MRLCALLSVFAAGCYSAPPLITAVVNSASYQTDGVPPGSIASLFGTGLAGGSIAVAGLAAPVIFASAGQINFQVPWEAQGSLASVTVSTAEGTSASFELPLNGAPGIYTADGSNAAMLISATGKIRVAHAGEYITVYATGLGAVQNTPRTGSAAAENGIAPVTASVSATIAGTPAKVGYAGLAVPGPNPYYVGVYEVQVAVPNGLMGGTVPLVLTVGGRVANTVMIQMDFSSDSASLNGGPPTFLNIIAPALYKWVQANASGGYSVRAISSNTVLCPLIMVDGKLTLMRERAAANPPLYPVTACEADIPAGTTSVTLDRDLLPLPKLTPQRFTVLGDTGCRMQTPTFQNCNIPAEWPASQIAASAAATKPDLLIHVGDYHYRESACPPGNAGCANSVWGYNWATWRDDVFEPLQATFPVAPWFLVRGNHESCARAGEGWFRFLDARPYQSACQVNTEPWSATAGPLQLFHVDTAEADDLISSSAQTTLLSTQFAGVRASAADNAWVLFHRPIWAVQPNGTNGNVNLQAAAGQSLGGGIKMVLSGHIHFFEALEWTPDRPAQVVVGNSGDNLAAPSQTLAGTNVAGATVTRGTSLPGFGFSTMELNADKTWTILDRDAAGIVKTTCTLVGTKIGCDR